jgi:hypothetical protein
MKTCSQVVKGGACCGKPATYRFTWPGNDEKYACQEHAALAEKLSGVLGFHLQLVPLEDRG